VSFLLDTDTCSIHLKRPGKVDARFVQYMGRLHVSAVTVAELYAWALRATAAPKRLQGVLDMLNDLIVLDVNHDVARKFGELRAWPWAFFSQLLGLHLPGLALVLGWPGIVLIPQMIRLDIARLSGIEKPPRRPGFGVLGAIGWLVVVVLIFLTIRVTIDGNSQQGASPNRNGPSLGDTAVVKLSRTALPGLQAMQPPPCSSLPLCTLTEPQDAAQAAETGHPQYDKHNEYQGNSVAHRRGPLITRSHCDRVKSSLISREGQTAVVSRCPLSRRGRQAALGTGDEIGLGVSCRAYVDGFEPHERTCSEEELRHLRQYRCSREARQPTSSQTLPDTPDASPGVN
jgi:hypothetical protein